ncbi:HTTM domain-containing protein [Streptomyces himalayensis]|uniref:HTTM domain-containing protein n=1 Tax=Streptomyces himalayensis TaxID=2820085 RepID=UPI0028682370|nr:HTTM domain-containing protein [Streptomyces himalayensis]
MSRLDRLHRLERPIASLARGIARVTATALGPYQTAVIRIGFAATWLLFLLRELPNRHEMYGPDGPWNWDMAQQLIANNHAFTVLMWSDSTFWFETVYVLALLSSVLLMLGWRTRTMSVLFMVGVLSLQNRSIFMGDGGDNVIHLMSVYLVLTRCGQVWSLDARRLRRAQEARARGERSGADEAGRPGGGADEAGRPGGGVDDTAQPRDGVDDTAQPWDVVDEAETRDGFDSGHSRDGFDDSGHSRDETDTREDETRDRVGPVLWWILGLALSVVTFMGELGWGWLLIFWGLWGAHGLWWAVERRAPGGELRLLLDVVANLVHNAALFVIMAEACLIYATAGWYKIQGSRWQDGTAVYYPLQLDSFSPWPALSDALAAHGTLVMLVTYGTVAVQVAFPFTLFNRRIKNVLLAAMVFEHAVIAVVLGLPFFSLAMITADAVFLPTSFLRRVGGWAARARGVLLPGRRRGSRGEPRVPGQRRGEEPDPESAEQARVGFTA